MNTPASSHSRHIGSQAHTLNPINPRTLEKELKKSA